MADTPTDSSAQTPPPQRAGILAFVQSLKASPAQQSTTTGKPSSVIPNKPTEGSAYKHFVEYSWAIQQNRWLKVSFIAHCALALLIWFGAYLTIMRPVYLQVGSPTLQEAAKTFYATDYEKVDPQLVFDQMSHFVITSLSLLHEVDAYSRPAIDLLRGMVRPEIIQRAQKRYEANRASIMSQKFVQNLVINRVLDPINNTKEGTVALFVEGFFAIILQDQNGDPINRVTPYRGKVILRYTPVSELNPFPFIIEDIEETSGADEAKKWDDANKKFFKK